MTATPPAILDVVERFERNAGFYRSPGYNEAPLTPTPKVSGACSALLNLPSD